MCLEGTREALLEGIKIWLRHFESLPRDVHETLHRLFWLFGLAGSGKSSVANSIAQWAEQEGFYLSCFFCKRDDPELSDPRKVLPTLAYRIAQLHSDYRVSLVSMLSSGSIGAGVVTSDIDKQFKLLFEDVLPRITPPPRAHVIVVDALDECGKPVDQKKLARQLAALAELTPWIKVIITSRPETAITNAFASFSSCKASDINAEEQTNSDIRRYIEWKLSVMDDMPYLFTEDISRLAAKAAGLFIWISTLFKYLEESLDKERDLRQFVMGEVEREPLQQLYALYDRILRDAVPPGHEKKARAISTILGLIFVTADNRPLSAHGLSIILGNDPRQTYTSVQSVQEATRVLHAVLYEDHKLGKVVRVYHPSFLDYLKDRIENGARKDSALEWMKVDELHDIVFKTCMSTMNRELKFNICGLNDSSLLNKEVDGLQEMISKNISELLQYSSLFWFVHLAASGLEGGNVDARGPVAMLLRSTKALFWLEILSFLDAISQGVVILQESGNFFTVRSPKLRHLIRIKDCA